MKTVYIVPATGFNPINDFYPSPIGKALPDSFQVTLRERLEALGFHVAFTRDAKDLPNFAGLIAWERPSNLSNLSAYPKEKCILLMFEPPVVDPISYDPKIKDYFGINLTLMDDLVDNVNYFKFCQPMPPFRYQRWKGTPLDFDKKSFSILVNSNKMFQHPSQLYSERRKVIQLFGSVGELDLYGPGWDGAPGWTGKAISFEEKMEALGRYKFCFCYENMGNQRGYVSEKLIDCFVGGCVPIYLGATNVTDYVPSDTFIDVRQFTDYQQLYSFLKQMDRQTHQSYLNAAEKFLNSDGIVRFTDEYNLKILTDLFVKSQKTVCNCS